MNFTFVCCYNNDEQIHSMLLPSLLKIGSVGQSQRIDEKYAHILIDNRNGQYLSAASAYNRVLRKSKELGDIIVFCHQDIAFNNTSIWEHAEERFKCNPNQILGVAGMLSCGITVSNLKYLDTDHYVTKCQVRKLTEVESLDECCFMMPSLLANKLPFDEYVCSSWHLYAVDASYAARIQYDIKSFVLPDEIYHKKNSLNGLYTDNSFLKSLWRMTRKYRHVYSTIYTPCYIISTNPLMAVAKISKTFFKNKLQEWFYQ